MGGLSPDMMSPSNQENRCSKHCSPNTIHLVVDRGLPLHFMNSKVKWLVNTTVNIVKMAVQRAEVMGIPYALACLVVPSQWTSWPRSKHSKHRYSSVPDQRWTPEVLVRFQSAVVIRDRLGLIRGIWVCDMKEPRLALTGPVNIVREEMH